MTIVTSVWMRNSSSTIGYRSVERLDGGGPLRVETALPEPCRQSVCGALHGGTLHGASALSAPGTLTYVAQAGSKRAPGQPGRAGREEPPKAMRASSGRSVEYPLEGLRVVLVEDDDDGRELVRTVLLEAGAVVESTASAAAGFDAICRGRPQMLVSDIGMPDEDGYALIRRVRALESCEGGDVPAIALSAFARPEDRMQALRAGFTMHIAKPVNPADLVSAMAQLAALMRRGVPRPSA